MERYRLKIYNCHRENANQKFTVVEKGYKSKIYG